jgi:hypothetical protein
MVRHSLETWDKNLKDGMINAYKLLESRLDKRTEADFQSAEVKAFYDEIIQKDNKAAAVETQVKGVFKTFEQVEGSKFMDNPYQTGITA